MTEKRLAQCQRVIGYYFSNPRLLETALTHSSLRSPDRECNERLEFLGDSILGLVITEELYHMLPDQSEGELTRIKSAVVSRSALLDASMRLGLPQYAEFARGVGKRDHLPASVVANLVESVIGAIYLDAGYYPAREFVLRHLGTAIDDELHDRGAKNYKSLLQHEVQQSVGITPTYRTLEADGPDHAKEFVVAAIIRGRQWGRAAGTTKKDAEQEAARKALEAWQRRGRGRRRRRRRRSNGNGDAAPAPVEVHADEKEHAAEHEKEPRTAAAAEVAPAPEPLEVEEVAAEQESAPTAAPEDAPPTPAEPPAPGPAEAPAPSTSAVEAAEPDKRRSPRRRRAAPGRTRRTERRAVAVEPAAEAPAPSPVEEPAPSPRDAPVASEAPAPASEPAAAAAPDAGFAAGIELEPGSASPPPRPVPERARVKVKAPSRKRAPRVEEAPSDDDDGFTSGILAD